MARIGAKNYLKRVNPDSYVFLVKYNGSSSTGCIHVGKILFPKHMVGKRFKVKLEEVKENINEGN